jgi:hypothetical protein
MLKPDHFGQKSHCGISLFLLSVEGCFGVFFMNPIVLGLSVLLISSASVADIRLQSTVTDEKGQLLVREILTYDDSRVLKSRHVEQGDSQVMIVTELADLKANVADLEKAGIHLVSYTITEKAFNSTSQGENIVLKRREPLTNPANSHVLHIDEHGKGVPIPGTGRFMSLKLLATRDDAPKPPKKKTAKSKQAMKKPAPK